MNPRDDHDWDVLAGEYVLGTLSKREQKLYDNIYRHDVDFQQRVTRWRERLAPLDAAVDPVAPDASVWQSIQRELRFSNSVKQSPDESFDESLDHSFDASLEHGTFHDESADFSAESSAQMSQSFDDTTGDFSSKFRPISNAHPGARSNVWRPVAGVASLAAVLLAGFLWYLTAVSAPNQQQPAPGFMSLIVDEAQTPLWIVEASPDAHEFRLVAVQPPTIAEDKAHELWLLKAGDQGVVSLGLLPTRAGQTLWVPLSFAAEDASGFAVSLEPEEGSLTDVPSGPVLYQGGLRTIQLDS